MIGSMVLKDPVYIYIGESMCHIAHYFSVLGIVHFFGGGFGIALMRFLLVQFSGKVHLRQRKIAVVISLGTLIVSCIVSYIWVNSPKRVSDETTVCLGRSNEFSHILFLYASDQSIQHEEELNILMILIFGIIVILLELAFYGFLCKFLLRHEKMMRLVLPENVIRGRMKKTVTMFIGHLISFALQLFWIFMLIVILKMRRGKQELISLAICVDSLFAMVQLAFSCPLRAECAKFITQFFNLMEKSVYTNY